MALNPLELVRAARSLDRLLHLEEKLTSLIEAQSTEIKALRDRLTKLEAREEMLIAEAKGAAAAMASTVASQHLTNLAQQLGAIDERTRQLTRLLPARNSD